MLKAVFFDMGGTIDTFRFTRQMRIDNASLIRDCLARVGLQTGLSDEQLADSITNGVSAYLRWNMVSNIELHPAEIWSRFFLKNIHVTPETLAPIAEELAFLYETRLYVREMRPEVPQILDRIQEMGLKIGCISNTQSHQQVPTSLKAYGISEYFNPVVLSSEYGRRKPDPSIFYYAARLASVPTGACAYIGDKINRDILGARRAGFRLAVQIVHPYDDHEKDEGATPDALIQDMTEFLPILQEELEKDRVFTATHPARKIKAIFFDAGDILYHRPHQNENLNRFLSNKTLQPHPDFAAEQKRLKDLAFSGKIRRHDYYEKVLRLYGIEDPAEIAEGVAAMSQDDNTVEIIPTVPETIRALKQRGYLLGIITDTAISFSRKLDWFDQYGFGHVWDAVISSKEIGERKPSRAMYENALRQTGVCASEAAFVGHKKTELDGAHAVGMHTIAFNYEKDAVADTAIRTFSDLLTLPLLEN
jgi:putative hydrolase of the HAD superfamily